MPTLAELVRSKYPGAYDDLSDEELEAKVDQKYPGAYNDVPRSSGGVPPGSSLPSPSPGGALPPSEDPGFFSRVLQGYGEVMNIPNRALGELAYGARNTLRGALGGEPLPTPAEPTLSDAVGEAVRGRLTDMSESANRGARQLLPEGLADTYQSLSNAAVGVGTGAAKLGTDVATDPMTYAAGYGLLARLGGAGKLIDAVDTALGLGLAAGYAPETIESLKEAKARFDAGDRSPETFEAATQALLGTGMMALGTVGAGKSAHSFLTEPHARPHMPEPEIRETPRSPEPDVVAAAQPVRAQEPTPEPSPAPEMAPPLPEPGFSELSKAALEPRLRAAWELERKIKPVREAFFAEKAGRSNSAAQAGGGRAALDAAQAALEGDKLKLNGTPVNELQLIPEASKFSQELQDRISNEAFTFGEGVKPIQLRTAIAKLIDNKRLEPEEIKIVKEATGIKVTDWERSKTGKATGAALGMLKMAWELPRTFVFGGDDSWVLRQGFIPAMSSWLGEGRGKDLRQAWTKHWVALSKERYETVQRELFNSPIARLGERYGVDFHELGKKQFHHAADDPFINIREVEDILKRVQEKNIPGVSQAAGGVKGVVEKSQQIYNVMANQMRAATFGRIVQSLDIDVQAALRGELKPGQREALQAAASWANVSTGRADTNLGLLNLNPGRGTRWLKASMRPLAYVFSSPSFQVARLQSLDPTYYLKLKKMSPEVAKIAAKETATALGTAAAITGTAAALIGGTVSWDPNDPDFAKVRKGKTRYDVMGGFTPFARAVWMSASGKKKSLAGVYRPQGLKDTWTGYVANKMHPSARLLGEFASGEERLKDQEAFEFAEGNLAPAFLQDVLEVFREDGVGGPLLLATVLGVEGGGVSMYAEPRQLSTEEQAAAQEYNANFDAAREAGRDSRVELEKAAKESLGSDILPARKFDVLKALEKQHKTLAEEPYIARIAAALASNDLQQAYAIEAEARRQGINKATVGEAQKRLERLLR